MVNRKTWKRHLQQLGPANRPVPQFVTEEQIERLTEMGLDPKPFAPGSPNYTAFSPKDGVRVAINRAFADKLIAESA